MKHIATIGSVLFASVLAVSADTEEQKRRLAQELRNIPVPELPARAAEIVRSTPAAERSQAAIIAVETIVAQYPASATTVVAAIAKAAPETAPAAAAAAQRLVPGEAVSVQSAARQTPAKAGEVKHVNPNGNGNANGGVGIGPGPNKPGRPVVRDEPSTVLPNGKPRHFPPSPPNRPVNPPRPHQYNKPNPN